MDKELLDLFQHFDTNKDGHIDRNELTHALRTYNANMTSHDINNVFNEMDTNRDGEIEFAEFKAVMEDRMKRDILN
jgi:calmodulin